jgi:hypothetical protein
MTVGDEEKHMAYRATVTHVSALVRSSSGRRMVVRCIHIADNTTSNLLLDFRHPEPTVTFNCRVFGELILRQAQDDG